MAKRILILGQAISQDYLDLLIEAFEPNTEIDVISGSELSGKLKLYKCQRHDATSLSSRLKAWFAYCWFVAKWTKKNKHNRYDMIYAVSNPPMNSWVGLRLKRIFHCPFVYMNWDLYPQIIRETMKSKTVRAVCRVWSRWNSENYCKIDKMLTIGEVMAESINADIDKKTEVNVIPIPVDTERLKPIEKRANSFAAANGLGDKFVVLYSGKLGRGHNIKIILNAAKLLSEYREIQFVFIGKGERYSEAVNFVSEYGLNNVSLYDWQPDDVFPHSMACGDIGIVSQEERIANLFMPSKTYSMMACGEAIVGICSKDDDLKRLIEDGSIGECVTDGDAEGLSRIILELYEDKKKLDTYKDNARKLAVLEYSSERIKEKYRRLFKEVIESS